MAYRRSGGEAGSPGGGRKAGCKFLWIKLALFEKQLVKIVEHLVDNSRSASVRVVTDLYCNLTNLRVTMCHVSDTHTHTPV